MFGVSLPLRVYAIFSIFAKNSRRNCYKKKLITPIKGTRIHGNTSYEPLTTFLRRMMRSVSKNVKK